MASLLTSIIHVQAMVRGFWKGVLETVECLQTIMHFNLDLSSVESNSMTVLSDWLKKTRVSLTSDQKFSSLPPHSAE